MLIIHKNSIIQKNFTNTIDITLIIDYNSGSLISTSCSISVQVSGCSSVWLEYLVWDQGVEGSSPFTPTTFKFVTLYLDLVWWD